MYSVLKSLFGLSSFIVLDFSFDITRLCFLNQNNSYVFV